MTGHSLKLIITLESTEGIHDFIETLPQIIEDLEGGYEAKQVNDESVKGSWIITPVPDNES